MNRNIKIALLLGAGVIIGGSTLAFAHMDGPTPPDGPMQGLVHRGRLADRLLEEFDANKDGKVTRAEFNNAIGTRFAAATHGAKEMTEDQFIAIHQGDVEKHAADMFHRLDWNGDGRLSLEEFEAPQRAHFQMMDHDGTGTVSCSPVLHADYKPASGNPPPQNDRRDWHGRGAGAGQPGHRGFGGRGGFGRAAFCNDSDASRDGKVTRAEFDADMAKHFQSATGGQSAMTLAQFTADMSVRYRAMEDKMFKRLDTDGNGRLTMAEFAAPPLKMFDRLDRNHDGVITADEMKPHFRGRGDWGRGHRGDDRGPPPSADE
ncbi:MAG TPA: EF-hand domain-containing protein [Rhizomicrobium sp.]|nr:EF-hand domain-containing protein [Rhizomicrobium sp.]